VIGPAAAAVTRPRRPPLLLTATATIVVGLVLLPLAYLAVRAVSGWPDAWRVLLRSGTLDLILDTAVLVVAVVAGSIAIGVPLAWLVTRTDLPGRRAWAAAAALPLVIPSYVAALALLGAFGPRGMLQRLLEPLGVDRLPAIYGFPGAFLALTLSTYPYVFLLAAAALRTADPALEEAARGLGSSRAGVLRRVTLPGLRPSIGAGALLVALYTLSDFGAVSLMQYDALTRAIFLQYRALFDRTPAAVLSLVLVGLTAVVLLLEARSRRRGAYHRSSPGAARPAKLVRLGRWRWAALAFCTAVVGLFLVVPVAVLAYWAARAVPLGHGIDVAWRPALNSLVVSALAAGAGLAAVLPVALLAHRYPSAWSRTLERLSFSANALPGIVIALSLVFFAANYAGALYQTLVLLVFAYVVRFFPQALSAVSSALRGVNPRLEDAARGLGRRPLGVLLHVTAPLIRQGLLAGAALVFLSAMKELPATLLLRPIGFDTLATEIWKYTALGSYSRAAPPALLLILVSAPFVYAVATRRGTGPGAPG
jgi:iron(III) transport system permease protein